MSEAARIEERAKTMPIQRKASADSDSRGRFTQRNPYSGRALPISGKLAGKIRDSFGIDAGELSLRESPDVAAMGASATAQGNVIRFAPGEFNPDTSEGMSVLGHELHHVREQASGGVHAPVGQLFEHPGHEAASDRAGAAFAGGSLSAAGPVSLGGMSAESAPVQGKKKKKAPVSSPMSDADRSKYTAWLKEDTFNNNRSVESTAFMDSLTQGGQMESAHELMGMGFQNYMVPRMTAATEDWQESPLTQNIGRSGERAMRGNHVFNKLNTSYLNNILKDGNASALGTLEQFVKSGRHNNTPAFNSNDMDANPELHDMTMQIMQGVAGSLTGNEDARRAFSGMDGALAQVPFYANDQRARNRSNLNNMILRVINPTILNHEANQRKVDKKGVRKEPTAAQAKVGKMDMQISRYLQKRMNDYSGGQEAGEANNPMFDLFDQMIGTLSAPAAEPAAAVPEAAAPEAAAPQAAAANEPQWESNDAFDTDTWKAPAAAPTAAPQAAARKPWYKRLWNSLRRR